jgi:dTDP-4-dehydrorhamnose 3,5-epimerase
MLTNSIHEVIDAYLIQPQRFYDERGWFQESFSLPKFHFDIKQGNISCSRKHTIRALHVAPFAKLCTCVRGKIFDVVADPRKDSPTYGKWFGTWLTPENGYMLYIPPNCGHGFYATENDSLLLYFQDSLYDPKVEREINWKDPTFAIDWPHADEYIISERDRKAPFLE